MHSLLMEWSELPPTGIAIIDEQRRGVVSTLNTLFYFIGRRQGMNVVNAAIGSMQQYTVVCFATEEQILVEMQYPGLTGHKKQHEALVKILYDAGKHSERMRAPETFLRFLKAWWMEHAVEHDLRFVEYMRESGIPL